MSVLLLFTGICNIFFIRAVYSLNYGFDFQFFFWNTLNDQCSFYFMANQFLFIFALQGLGNFMGNVIGSYGR